MKIEFDGVLTKAEAAVLARPLWKKGQESLRNKVVFRCSGCGDRLFSWWSVRGNVFFRHWRRPPQCPGPR